MNIKTSIIIGSIIFIIGAGSMALVDHFVVYKTNEGIIKPIGAPIYSGEKKDKIQITTKQEKKDVEITAKNSKEQTIQKYKIVCPIKFLHHSITPFIPLSILHLVNDKKFDAFGGIGLGYMYQWSVLNLMQVGLGGDFAYSKSFKGNELYQLNIRSNFQF